MTLRDRWRHRRQRRPEHYRLVGRRAAWPCIAPTYPYSGPAEHFPYPRGHLIASWGRSWREPPPDRYLVGGDAIRISWRTSL